MVEKPKNTILIESAVLKWARESIGFSIEEASEKTKIKADELKRLESESSEIKISDIKKFARAYKRALSFFFLQKPPEDSPVPKDFRTLDSVDIETLSPETRLAIRQAQRKRKFFAHLLQVSGEEPDRLPQIHFNVEPSVVAKKFRQHLGVTIDEQKEWENESFAFNRWIDFVEKKGIPVFQIKLPKKEIRGFCLRENNLPPVIVINARDAIRGRIFTLFHEFYHLLLLQSDINTLVYSRGEKTAHMLIEMKANDFAGSFLVPNEELLKEEYTKQYITTREDRFITHLINLYKVSGEVLCRRLVVNGIMTETAYEQKRKDFLKYYEQEAIKKKQKIEESKKPFIPNYYLDVVKGSSYDLSRKAFSATSEGKISTNELVTFLGVKLSGLKKVLNNTMKHYPQNRKSTDKHNV